MPVRRTITVSITAEQDDLIRSCLGTGRYATTSEVVRAALRLLAQEETSAQPAVSRSAAPERATSRA